MDAAPPRLIQVEDFQPLVGQLFEVNCNPQPVTLRLVEAKPLGSASATDSGAFILVFHTAPDIYLVDGIYKMEAKGFPLTEIGIGGMIPPKNAEPGYYYQAVFN